MVVDTRLQIERFFPTVLTGAEFTLCGKRSQSVTLRVSEKTGELFMLQNETGMRLFVLLLLLLICLSSCLFIIACEMHWDPCTAVQCL